MRTILLAATAILAAASSANAQQAPTWTGRDVAATAQPLTVVDLSSSAQRRGERVVTRDSGRDIGFRPPRSIHVDPFGNVTTFVGTPPPWISGGTYESGGYSPEERRFYGQPVQPTPPRRSPCVAGGPATASSAIAQAANGSGC